MTRGRPIVLIPQHELKKLLQGDILDPLVDNLNAHFVTQLTKIQIFDKVEAIVVDLHRDNIFKNDDTECPHIRLKLELLAHGLALRGVIG